MDSFYANQNSVYYTFECYVDNKCVASGKRYCYVTINGIRDRATHEYRGSFTAMLESKEELARVLNSFTAKPIVLELNEI